MIAEPSIATSTVQRRITIPHLPPRRSSGLFDWLFGLDEPREEARPPQTYPPDRGRNEEFQPPPQRDDRFRDPYRDR